MIQIAARINLITLHVSDHIEGLDETGADPSSFGKQCFKMGFLIFFLNDIFNLQVFILGGA